MPVTWKAAAQQVCIRPVKVLPTEKIRHQYQKIGCKRLFLLVRVFVICKSNLFQSRDRHKNRRAQVQGQILFRPYTHIIRQSSGIRGCTPGAGKMECLPFRLRCHTYPYNRVRDIIYRNDIQLCFSADRKNAQFTLEHQFQDIIDCIKASYPAGLRITDNHSGTADGEWQSGCAHQLLRLCLTPLIHTGKIVRRQILFIDGSASHAAYIRSGNIDESTQLPDVGCKGKHLLRPAGICVHQLIPAFLKSDLRPGVDHLCDLFTQFLPVLRIQPQILHRKVAADRKNFSSDRIIELFVMKPRFPEAMNCFLLTGRAHKRIYDCPGKVCQSGGYFRPEKSGRTGQQYGIRHRIILQAIAPSL